MIEWFRSIDWREIIIVTVVIVGMNMLSNIVKPLSRIAVILERRFPDPDDHLDE